MTLTEDYQMKNILHWMLCHTVVLVLMIFIILAYYFREPVLGIKVSVPSPSLVSTKISSEDALEIEQNIEKAEIVKIEPKEILTPKDADYNFRPKEDVQIEVEENLLQSARKAYWNDELDRAKTLYYAYIDMHPDHPDGYGELGNLLSTIGDLESAAEMYKKAAKLLIKEGKNEQAKQLQEVLNSIEVIQKIAE